MKRVYVVMEWDSAISPLDHSVEGAEPIDVVSTMDAAEGICDKMQEEHPEFTYYWREVISSEE